jgi:hypothetical protein
MPVGLIGALELLQNFENVWVPSLHIFRGVDFPGPWNYKQSLTSFDRLVNMSVIAPPMRRYKTYSHVPSKDQLMHDRKELEMRLEYWIRPGVPSLRKCIDSIKKSI